MGVAGLWKYIERVGGPERWEAKAREHQVENKGKGKKRGAEETKAEEERRKRQWVEENRLEDEEWTFKSSTAKEVVDWMKKRSGKHRLGPVGKVAVDLGQIAVPIEQIQRKLWRKVKHKQISPTECKERFEFGRLALINLEVDRIYARFGEQVRPCVAFDHPDTRPEAKKETLEERAKSKMKGRLNAEGYRLSRERTEEIKRRRASKRKKKDPRATRIEGEEKQEVGEGEEEGAKEPRDGEGTTDAEETEVGGSGCEDRERIIEEVVGPEELDPPNDEEMEVQLFEINEELFPRLVMTEEEEPGPQVETEWSNAARKEALRLRDRADLVFAKTECDYLLPAYLAGDSLPADPRVEKYVRRRTEPVPSGGTGELPETRIIISQDSDLLIASGPDVASGTVSCDFVWSSYRSGKGSYERVVDLRGMYTELRLEMKYQAAGLAGFLGTDFTNKGVKGVGAVKLFESRKHSVLRDLALKGEAFLKARKEGEDSEMSTDCGTWREEALEKFVKSMNECAGHQELSLDRWLDSIAIQVGQEAPGSVVSKAAIEEKLEKEAWEKLKKDFNASHGKRQGTEQESPRGTENRGQPRQHLVTFDQRSSNALPVDPKRKPIPTIRDQELNEEDKSTPEKDYPKPYRTTGGFNGPELLRRLGEEHTNLRETAGEANAGDGTRGPVAKKAKTSGKGKGKGKEKEVEGAGKPEGRGGAKARGQEGPGEEEEGTSKPGKAQPRFPNGLGAKMATDTRPASSRVIRRIELEGVDNLPESLANVLSWIRHWGMAEMPTKVSLANMVLDFYYLFDADRLLQIINGGNKFTSWFARIMSRRQWYEEHVDKSSHSTDSPPATVEDLKPLIHDFQAKLGPERFEHLKEFALEVGVKKADVDFIRNAMEPKSVDVFVMFAVIAHSNSKLVNPQLVDGGFDERNAVPFATSFSNSTAKDALGLDWIIARLITRFPGYLDVDRKALPFGLDNSSVRALLQGLRGNTAACELLLSLADASDGLRTVRNAMQEVPIGKSSDQEKRKAVEDRLRSELHRILARIGINSAVRSNKPIRTEDLGGAIEQVLSFVVEAVDLMSRYLRKWIAYFEVGEEIVTLEKWVEAAKGIDAKEGGTVRGGGKRRQGKGNPSKQSKVTLSQLKVVTASLTKVRRRQYRFSPQFIFMNLPILRRFAGPAFNFQQKLEVVLKQIQAACELHNASKLSTTPVAPAPSLELRKKTSIRIFDARKVQGDAIRRYKTDPTIRLQLENPGQVVFDFLHEWRGLEFETVESPGPFLVRRTTASTSKGIRRHVGAVHQLFEKIGLSELQVNVCSTVVMDVIFKQNFGQRLPTGDIGISGTKYHFAVVDFRYREQQFVKAQSEEERLRPWSQLMLEEMNSDARLVGPFRQMAVNIQDLEETVFRTTALPPASVESTGQRDRHDGEQKNRRGRRRPLTRKEQRQIVPFSPRFVCDNEQKITLAERAIDSNQNQPSRDAPVQVHYARTPHLGLREVGEDEDPLNSSVRARDMCWKIFAEARVTPIEMRGQGFESLGAEREGGSDGMEVEGAGALAGTGIRETGPTVVVDDVGQHYAIVTGVIPLKTKGSVRQYLKQGPYAEAERQNSRVTRSLTESDATERLMKATKSFEGPLPRPAPQTQHTSPLNTHDTVAATQAPAIADQVAYPLPLPEARPAPAPTSTAPSFSGPQATPQTAPGARSSPLVFQEQLSELEPILQGCTDSRRSRALTLRREEVEGHTKRQFQRDAASRVKDSFPLPGKGEEIGDPRKVLYITSRGAIPSGGHFGQSVAGRLMSSYISALKSLPHIEASIITTSEAHTSSVCPNPQCRSTLFRPHRCSSSPINRIKYCIWEKSMDNRDGLASGNILAIVYHVCHTFVGNPLSFQVAEARENVKRVRAREGERIEKVVEKALADRGQAERREVMTRFSEGKGLGRLGKGVAKDSAEKKGMDLETDSELEGDEEGVDPEEEGRETRNTRGRRQRREWKGTSLDDSEEEEGEEELGMSAL